MVIRIDDLHFMLKLLVLFYMELFLKFDSTSANVCHNRDSSLENCLDLQTMHITVFSWVVSGEEQKGTRCGVVPIDIGKWSRSSLS